MRHEHHVTGPVVLVVESQEVDLAKHRSRPNDAFAVFEKVRAECLDKGGGVVRDCARGDFRVESRGERFPAVVFEDGDDLRRLCESVKKLYVLLPARIP